MREIARKLVIDCSETARAIGRGCFYLCCVLIVETLVGLMVWANYSVLDIQARVKRDAAFRKELLRESVESFLMGDIETGKAVLRDYINATIGFAELAKVTHHSAKSLMRMLGPSGNPQARNLFEIVEYLQRKERVHFTVVASIRRGLAQARKGMGRPAEQVFDELERADPSR